jgi:hypothetical protein
MIIYISGPMTGHEDLNFPAFYEAEEILKARGFEVINPAAIEQPDKTWEACMRKDNVELMRADMIVTLPNWERSKGARLEVEIGTALGMKVRTLFTRLQEVPSESNSAEAIN